MMAMKIEKAFLGFVKGLESKDLTEVGPVELDAIVSKRWRIRSFL